MIKKYIASDVLFQTNDNILILDNDERSAMRVQTARMRKRKHKKIEKFNVDPIWLENIRNKRRKIAEADGEEVSVDETKAEMDKVLESMPLESIINGDSNQIKLGLLSDYLNHIKSL